MRVFRVQNEDGLGPYRGNALDSFRYGGSADYGGPDPFNTSYDHPDPSDDYLLYQWEHNFIGKRDYSFGFKSKEDALRWFYREEWRKALADAGYVITEWEVSRQAVHVGTQQLVFLRQEGTLLDKHLIPAKTEGLALTA